MRKTVVALAAALLSSLFSVATARAEGGNSSLKGWELYSWTDAECYGAQRYSEIRTATCYALLPGTNREKTVAEIRKEPLHLYDLKKQLAELRKGEEIFWSAPTAAFNEPGAVDSRSSLPAPPHPVVIEAQRLGLKLHLRRG